MMYIFDLDGTLCDISHRLHHIQKSPADWRSFFAECPNDQPVAGVLSVCYALQSANHTIAIISGRSDEVQVETSKWLRQQHVNYDFLYMRKAGDHREDSVVKAELLDQLIKEWPRPIGGIFEDRQQVVDMYRARGLRVFQVADGKF
jgi:phosphoglycolate phosphatase-like HAD superfamily hydrolase